MARIQEGMPSHEAIEAIMKRVPAARGSNKNLSPSNRAKKALNSLSAHQLCYVLDAIWGELERSRPYGGQIRSTSSAYYAAVSFIARRIAEKEGTG